MRYLAFVFLFSLSVSGFAQNWALISPPNTQVQFFNFMPELNFASGTELWVHDWDGWSSTLINLPVTGTEELSSDELLFVCGDGSYSDGIYKMNTSTGDYSVIEYFYKPQFIEFINDSYYIGYDGGVAFSSDLENWETLFSSGFDTIFSYLFIDESNYIAVGYNADNWFFMYSADSGETWASNDIYLPVNDVIYNNSNDLLFIALGEGFSENDGLYKSEDYGMSLAALRKEKGINALHQIDNTHLALGYAGDSAEHEGVASYDLATTLHFSITGNLPGGDVNDLTTNPLVNSVNVVASTVNGAYQADNILAINDFNVNNYNIHLWPNPVRDNIYISGNLEFPATINCNIYDIQGRLIFQEQRKFVGSGDFLWQITGMNQYLTGGTYFMELESHNKSLATKKFVKK